MGPLPELLDNVPMLLDMLGNRLRSGVTDAAPLLERLGLLSPPDSDSAPRDPAATGGRYLDAARALAACAAGDAAAAALRADRIARCSERRGQAAAASPAAAS